MTDSKQNLLLRARSAATRRLIDAHDDEFHKLYEQEAQSLGVTYERPETPESKAEKQMKELLEEFPHLRKQFEATGDIEPENAGPSVDGSTITG